jgi:hypothetical protein
MPKPANSCQLMPGDAARFAIAACPRSDDEIVLTGSDRLDQLRDSAWIVRAVAIHEHDDIDILGRRRCCQLRPAPRWHRFVFVFPFTQIFT